MTGQDSGKLSPMGIAVQSGEPSLVRAFIDAGIDLSKECCGKLPPLHFAVQQRKLSCLKELIRGGADLDQVANGHYALCFAAWCN